MAARALCTAVSRTVVMPPNLISHTPLVESVPLSAICGTRVLLKMDALQPSGSFKDRGMAFMCATLKERGVTSLICSSGGNAGHAVAAMGRRLGMTVRVIVPTTTKQIMLEKIKAQDADHELPMQPITMMRNALGVQEGGSGVPLDPDKYAAAIAFWSRRAVRR